MDDRHSLIDEGRMNNLIVLATKSCCLHGDMAELGVYEGGSALSISRACPQRTLHLFDTFRGIPEDDLVGEHKKGEFASNVDQVKNLLHGRNVEFHVGVFPASWSEMKPYARLSFVHVDADTYQSTEHAINIFYPALVVGGIMVFDDYCWYKCPGVTISVHQNFENREIHKMDKQCWVIKAP